MPRLLGIRCNHGISVGALRAVIEPLSDSTPIKVVISDGSASQAVPIVVHDTGDAVLIEVVMCDKVSDRETRKREREALDELAAMTQDMDGYPELK